MHNFNKDTNHLHCVACSYTRLQFAKISPVFGDMESWNLREVSSISEKLIAPVINHLMIDALGASFPVFELSFIKTLVFQSTSIDTQNIKNLL